MLKSTIKRLIAVLLAVFMIILCTTGAYAAETPTEDEQPTHSPIYFGDITDDADNKPTIKDATLIQQYVADIKTLQNIRTYAFTKDGTTSVKSHSNGVTQNTVTYIRTRKSKLLMKKPMMKQSKLLSIKQV